MGERSPGRRSALLICLLAGCSSSPPAPRPAPPIASSTSAGAGEPGAPAQGAPAQAAAESATPAPPAPAPPPPRKPELVEQCDATPIPKNPDLWDEHRLPWPQVRFEVPYGPDVKQTYDVTFFPPTDAMGPVPPRPLVAIIHGGGWTAGDKHMFWPTLRALNEHGFVGATINYRLARNKERAFPAGVRDTRCALAHLVQHAAEYGADPSRLAIIGASAGAHVAALIAVQPNAPELMTGCEETRLPIAGVIGYYGPVGLTTENGYPKQMKDAVAEFFRTERGTPEWDALARRATPATFVSEATPPILLIHGGADNIVPVDDSRDFLRTLDAHGVPSLLVELPEQKHGFAVLSRKPELARATCTAWAFLDRVLAAAPR